MSATLLRGLGLSNFRGIGEPGSRLAPFRGINFFIGPNNSGKSTVLHFIATYLDPSSNKRGALPWTKSYASIDLPLGKPNSSVKYEIAVSSEDFASGAKGATKGRWPNFLNPILDGLDEDGLVWRHPTQDGSKLQFSSEKAHALRGILQPHEWQTLWHGLTGGSSGDMSHWFPATIERLAAQAAPSIPRTNFIPAIRQMSETGSEFTDFSGRGLIDRLATLQNPAHDERHNRAKFEQVNQFLQEVTDSPHAQIEVPHDRRHLLVHMDGKILPLSSLGTGIHEVIMLAAFCTMVDEQVVCIEEPEIHLHPLLQRKLIRYLDKNTNNQYFVATHSASILDAVAGASIFSVSNVDGETQISIAVTPHDRFEICRQLGYHASDLLQSNAVIWVEGPSDRIYINHWIKAVDPELIEGTDYSIMFYGGRLLNHLSANDPEIDEFISLRRLNRNLAVVIDSDKSSANAKVLATKKRLLTELGDGVCWITAGREIENYVPVAQISKAVGIVHSKTFSTLDDVGRYAHRLHYKGKGTSPRTHTDVDKIKVAQLVASEPADLSELDLRKRIGELIAMIRGANPKK